MAKNNKQSAAVTLAVFLLLLGIRVFASANPIADALEPPSRIGKWLNFDYTDDGASTFSPREQELIAENESLRDELKLPERPQRKTVNVDIVGKTVQSYRQVVRVNRGSNSGVKVDDAVLSENQLIGVVKEVTKQTALITLINDPDFRAAAVISGTKLEGVAKVESGGLFIDKLERSDQEIVSKTVLTSGLGGVFPPGLYLGEIGDELSEDKEIFGKFVIRRSQRFGDVRVMQILIGDKL